MYIESESLRGYTLLSPTLLAMLVGLAMPLIVPFNAELLDSGIPGLCPNFFAEELFRFFPEAHIY